MALCCADMALYWILLTVFLLTTLTFSHSSEHGAPHGRRRQTQTSAGGANVLQQPLQSPRVQSQSRDQDRPRASQGSRTVKSGAGRLSHRALHPLARPEDDGTGLEGLSPVRLEMGHAGDVRIKTKSQSQIWENQLAGTKKGRGHRSRHGHRFEHRRHGAGRRDRGRHGKGEVMFEDKVGHIVGQWVTLLP